MEKDFTIENEITDKGNSTENSAANKDILPVGATLPRVTTLPARTTQPTEPIPQEAMFQNLTLWKMLL